MRLCGNRLNFPVPAIPLREERWKPGANDVSNGDVFVRISTGDSVSMFE